jgi:hypothetical protein
MKMTRTKSKCEKQEKHDETLSFFWRFQICFGLFLTMEVFEDVVDSVRSGAASRSVFKPAHNISRFYTGNIKCQLCPDGSLASASLDRLNFVDLAKGRAVKKVVLVSGKKIIFFFFFFFFSSCSCSG